MSYLTLFLYTQEKIWIFASVFQNGHKFFDVINVSVFQNGHKFFDVINVCCCCCLILLFNLTRFLNIGISQQSIASIFAPLSYLLWRLSYRSYTIFFWKTLVLFWVFWDSQKNNFCVFLSVSHLVDNYVKIVDGRGRNLMCHRTLPSRLVFNLFLFFKFGHHLLHCLRKLRKQNIIGNQMKQKSMLIDTTEMLLKIFTAKIANLTNIYRANFNTYLKITGNINKWSEQWRSGMRSCRHAGGERFEPLYCSLFFARKAEKIFHRKNRI